MNIFGADNFFEFLAGFAGAVLAASMLLALPIWGVVDAATRPADAWSAVRGGRRFWIIVQIVLNFLGSFVYFGFVRPRLKLAGRPMDEQVRARKRTIIRTASALVLFGFIEVTAVTYWSAPPSAPRGSLRELLGYSRDSGSLEVTVLEQDRLIEVMGTLADHRFVHFVAPYPTDEDAARRTLAKVLETGIPVVIDAQNDVRATRFLAAAVLPVAILVTLMMLGSQLRWGRKRPPEKSLRPPPIPTSV